MFCDLFWIIYSHDMCFVSSCSSVLPKFDLGLNNSVYTGLCGCAWNILLTQYVRNSLNVWAAKSTQIVIFAITLNKWDFRIDKAHGIYGGGSIRNLIEAKHYISLYTMPTKTSFYQTISLYFFTGCFRLNIFQHF